MYRGIDSLGKLSVLHGGLHINVLLYAMSMDTMEFIW